MHRKYSNSNKKITLDEALEIALSKNTQIFSARNNFRGTKSGLIFAYGGLLPTLTSSTGNSETQNHTLIAGDNTTKNFSTSISSRVVLFDGFANTSDINKANANIASAEFGLKRIVQSVIFETKRRYLQVLRNASLLKVSQENLKRSQQQLQRITEINKVGAAPKADVYRQQVATANDELALIRVENNYKNSKADLLYYISLSPDEDFDYVSPNIDDELKSISNKKIKSYNELVNRAIEIRPDYLASIANKESAESDKTIARAGFYPTVSANGSYTLSDKKFSTINDNTTFNWGLTFSVPIFSGFATNYAIEIADVKFQNTEEESNQTKRQVQVDIRKALLDFESTLKELEVTEKNILSAQEDLRIADERYKLGANTLLDLLVASTNFVRAQSDKINAQYNYLTVKEQLNFAVGESIY